MEEPQEVDVWQEAGRLAHAVERAAREFPWDVRFGLTRQLSQAVEAVADHIADGCAHAHELTCAPCISEAAAKLVETDYLLLLARDLEYLPASRYRALHSDIRVLKEHLLEFDRAMVRGG